MKCRSSKTLFVLLGIAGFFGFLIVTEKVGTYAILPFLLILACPLMCILPHMFGKSCHGDECQKKRPKSTTPPPHSL